MPSASDNTATLVTVGVAISERQASRQSTVNQDARLVAAPVGRVGEDSHDACRARRSAEAIPQGLHDGQRPEAGEHRESPSRAAA